MGNFTSKFIKNSTSNLFKKNANSHHRFTLHPFLPSIFLYQSCKFRFYHPHSSQPCSWIYPLLIQLAQLFKTDIQFINSKYNRTFQSSTFGSMKPNLLVLILRQFWTKSWVLERQLHADLNRQDDKSRSDVPNAQPELHVNAQIDVFRFVDIQITETD